MIIRWTLAVSILSTLSCSGSSFKGQNSAGESQGTDSQSSDVARSQILENLAESGIVDAESLSAACKEAGDDVANVTRKLVYPERKDCSFAAGVNLERKNQFVQAREINPGSIDIPEGAVICNLSIKSQPNAQILYDDFIFLTIEKQVIFGSNKGVTEELSATDGIYQWDWSTMVGKEIQNFEDNYYCLGNARTCVLPPHDTAGPISLELQSNDIAPIALAVAGKTKLEANLIATGDNDDEDCMHTELDLDVVVEYIQAVK